MRSARLGNLTIESVAAGLKYYPLMGQGQRFPVNDPDMQPVMFPRPGHTPSAFCVCHLGLACGVNNAVTNIQCTHADQITYHVQLLPLCHDTAEHVMLSLRAGFAPGRHGMMLFSMTFGVGTSVAPVTLLSKSLPHKMSIARSALAGMQFMYKFLCYTSQKNGKQYGLFCFRTSVKTCRQL